MAILSAQLNECCKFLYQHSTAAVEMRTFPPAIPTGIRNLNSYFSFLCPHLPSAGTYLHSGDNSLQKVTSSPSKETSESGT